MYSPLFERNPVMTCPGPHSTPAGRPPGLGRLTGRVIWVRGRGFRLAISWSELHIPTIVSIDAPVLPRRPRSTKPRRQNASETGRPPGLPVRPDILG